MRGSDAWLRLVSVVVAVGLLLVVRGERQVTLALTVPVSPRLPPALAPAGALPAEVTVTVSGAWARLRTLDGAGLGPAVLDLTRAGPGSAQWTVRPEALHVPRGVRVDSVYPVQGAVELVRPGGPPLWP